MKARQKKLVAILALLLAIALPTTTAYAITGNYQPDNDHPFVGLVVFYTLEDDTEIPISVSSGILLSPTKVLTAAHGCVTESAFVCFDEGPITWEIQGNHLEVKGITSRYHGIAYQNPDYSMNAAGKNGLQDFLHRDLALIILKESVPTSVVSTYGILPLFAGYVDTLPKKSDVTLVGYGLQRNIASQNLGSIMRNCARAETISSNFAWSDEFMRCSANPGNGRGGMSFGDSGGPVLLGQTNTVLAVHSYVSNPNCAGVSYHSRIDLPDVLKWIREVGT